MRREFLLESLKGMWGVFNGIILLLSLIKMSPNVAAQWLAFLLRIRKVLGSNFDPETGYFD
jgi:hypothetical protein